MLSAQTIKRISRELAQLSKDHLNGISVAQISPDNFREFIVNIRILEGPYIGSIAHCQLKLSEQHPKTAPEMSIFIGGGFEQSGHHHLFSRGSCISFCIDMLSNSMMTTQDAGTGWNPAYTISALLIQIQSFIADPDLHGHSIPEENLKTFRRMNISQQREFTINGQLVKHTFDQPYPPFHIDSLKTNNPIQMKSSDQLDSQTCQTAQISEGTIEQDSSKKEEQDIILVAKEEEEQSPKENNPIKLDTQTKLELEETKTNDEIAEHLRFPSHDDTLIKQYIYCYFTLQNAVDDPETLFGIPIYMSNEWIYTEKLKIIPLTEFISYEGYQELLRGSNEDEGISNLFKGSCGGVFNYWLPIYMSEAHFKRNQRLIERCIAEISGHPKEQFEINMVLDVIPSLMNAMFVKIFGLEDGRISYFAIQAYVQLYMLFKRFCQCYSELQEKVDQMVIDFVQSDLNRSKKSVSDFGCFFVILNASSFDYQYPAFLDLMYREQSARQMMRLKQNVQFTMEFSSESGKGKAMQIAWQQSKIGHDLLIFTIEASKYLTSPEFLSRIESNSFVVPENYAKAFVHHTRVIRENISGHKDLLAYFGLAQKYNTPEKVYEIFDIANFVQIKQGYFNRNMSKTKNVFKTSPAHLSWNANPLSSLPIKITTHYTGYINNNFDGILPPKYEGLSLKDVSAQENCDRIGLQREFINIQDRISESTKQPILEKDQNNNWIQASNGNQMRNNKRHYQSNNRNFSRNNYGQYQQNNRNFSLNYNGFVENHNNYFSPITSFHRLDQQFYYQGHLGMNQYY